MCEVVGAEAEELRVFGDFIGNQGAAWNFNHRADHVFDLGLFLVLHLLGHAMDHFKLVEKLLRKTDQHDHDLGLHRNAFVLDLHGRFNNGANLHLGDFGINDAEAATAQTEHRVEFMQFLDPLFDLFHRHVHFLRQILLGGVFVRQEFMQRRVERADGCWQAFQFTENSHEIVALIWQQFRKGFFPVLKIPGQNHLAHGVNPVAAEEHVFGAAEADARRAKRGGVGRLLRLVGVGAHLHPGHLRAPAHELGEHLIGRAVLGIERFLDEYLDDFRRGGRELAGIDFAGSAVDGEEVAFLVSHAVHGHGLGRVINL